ncbi:MAG: PD-(D/E)XK nuclease family protein [Bacteroidetes bacterium]|jgi:hypothetical protein|nr:PD-(D/E)XK nuclease family protein [Bacteroidota bacterium]MBL0079788.1 PD-(D/E)XK nuclease family protein [Bacteroidota bacterium]
MNIFKILSSGDQKLKEPAVTSFLAFLLDPYESHGLKTKFLEYFLKPIVENEKYYEIYKNLVVKNKEGKVKIKSNLIYEFDFNIDIEVSKYFIDEVIDNITNEAVSIKKRNDIDIVISITNKNNEEEKYTFIIENKLNDGAISNKGNQLEKQLKSYVAELKNLDSENICSIFLTPNSPSSNNYFNKFSEIEKYNSMPKYHHNWKNETNETKENTGVYYFLNDILAKESVGIIEPIQDYTKHTIKAFMNFIEIGFKSISDEKDEDESYKKKYYKTIDEIFDIWAINEENKALTNKILTELKNEDIGLAFTNRHISIKKPRNICGIMKPAKTIKSSIPCFIKGNMAINYDKDYILAKNGWYHLSVNENNIDRFIQNIRNLINNDNK